MDTIENEIKKIPELSKPVSIVSLSKYISQAFYNGNRKYYQVPSDQIKTFIATFAQTTVANSDVDLIKNYADSTGRYTRITAFMKDMETEIASLLKNKLEIKLKSRCHLN